MKFVLNICLGMSPSLARQCAQLWLKTRESLGHPLGIISQSGNSATAREVLEEAVAKVRVFRCYI